MKKLSPTQQNILKKAASRADGNIEPLPDNINAGIKQRVINGLLNRQLIIAVNNMYIISNVGFAAIGKKPKQTQTTKPTIINKEQPNKANNKKSPRTGSKLAALVALLEQQGGATLDDMMKATGWQQHTIRGTLAGTLQKGFGYNITSIKAEGKPRKYVIDPKKNEDGEKS